MLPTNAIFLCSVVGLVLTAEPELEVVHGNNEFGIQLMADLDTRTTPNVSSNLFISPYSISNALAMLLTGAADETYSEIYNALGYGLLKDYSSGQIFQVFRDVNAQLAERSMTSSNLLSVANAMVIQKNWPILPTFSNNLTTYFGSRILAEDFVKAANQAKKDINQWVSDNTQGKIASLFEKNLANNTVLVLLDVIYFKGKWQYKFDAKQTQMGPFQLTDKKYVQVPMMHFKGQLNYATFDDGQLVELPYQGGDLAMYIFVPTYFQPHFLNSFFNFPLEQRLKQFTNVTVELEMPKLKIDDEHVLVDTLQALGIRQVFDAKLANLTYINGEGGLWVSQVKHKAHIELNENGAEAAATTGIANRRKLSSTQPKVFSVKANRPFFFMICDKPTGVTLFAGVVRNP